MESGETIIVKYGTVNQATLWMVDSADTSITVDTDSIDFTSISRKNNTVSEDHLTTSIADIGLTGGNGTPLNVTFYKETDSGVLTNDEMNLSNTPADDSSMIVFRNGQALVVTDDYTRSGTTITFVDPTQVDDKFVVVHMINAV